MLESPGRRVRQGDAIGRHPRFQTIRGSDVSLRAILLGLALGLFISVGAYFNDAVMGQRHFIGGLLPVIVAGVLLILLLVINPLLRGRALRAGELAVIVAMGMAACAWPSATYFRVFGPVVTMPGYLNKDKPAWQGVELLSYVPGASPRIAQGQIADWWALVDHLRAGEASWPDDAAANDPVGLARDAVWVSLPLDLRDRLLQRPEVGDLPTAVRYRLLTSLNDMIERAVPVGDLAFGPLLETDDARAFTRHVDALKAQAAYHAAQAQALRDRRAAIAASLAGELEQFAERRRELERQETAASREALRQLARDSAQVRRPLTDLDHAIKLHMLHAESAERSIQTTQHRLSRHLLDLAMNGTIRPPPRGDGWLLAGGVEDPLATGMYVGGWDGVKTLMPTQLPWGLWRSTLLLWAPLTLLIALAGLCLMLVVHPQWSKHELLPYPIARFIEEVTARQPGHRLPEVARSRLFWIAVLCVFAIHLVNGLAAYNPTFIRIPLRYDFLGMRALFPVASLAPLAWSVFIPGIFFSIVGFSFFLRTEVSLSFGLSGVAYMLLASALYHNGIAMEYNPNYGGNANLILFGAWLGGALVVVYVGRRYYASVLARALGVPVGQHPPVYSIWAARGLMLACVAAVWVMAQAGLTWTIGLLLLLLILMVFLMIARINAETGAFFILPEWIPLAVLLALMGERALGPTAIFTAGLVSLMFAGETREALTPLIANGLRMTEHTGSRTPRMGGLLAMMLVIGFGATLVATLMYQYNLGLDLNDDWGTKIVPSKIPDATVRAVDELTATHQLSESVALGPLERLAAIQPRAGAWGWIGLGAALVLGCAAARLRFAWWPLHPVIFMVFGTHPAAHAHYSFLLGWAIKASVVRLGGSRSYRLVMPLMVGLIAADMLAALFWFGVGGVIYALGGTPMRVGIFPP